MIHLTHAEYERLQADSRQLLNLLQILVTENVELSNRVILGEDPPSPQTVYQWLAEKLVEAADAAGVIVTIEQVSNWPPRMRDTRSVASVRQKR